MKIEVQTDRKNKSKKRFKGGGKLTGGKIVHSYSGVELLHFIQIQNYKSEKNKERMRWKERYIFSNCWWKGLPNLEYSVPYPIIKSWLKIICRLNWVKLPNFSQMMNIITILCWIRHYLLQIVNHSS